MKKFSFVLVALVVGLFLLFPSFSFAQKGKKATVLPNQKVAITPKETCNLTLQQVPPIQGVRVGMSREEAQNAFLQTPSLSESIKDDAIGFSALMSRYVYKATDKDPETKAEFQARIMDNRVFAVSWELMPLIWKTPDEAVKTLSKQWNVPERAWIQEKKGYAELQCKGFTAWVDTEIYDFAGRQSQRMGIFEPLVLSTLEKRDAKRKQEEEEKRRNRIKP